MDNLSHSVVGLAVGELVQRSLAPEPDAARQSTRHRLLLVACTFASNFPDLDLVFTRLLPAPLGYLLHHRGHTHTLLYALPQALVLIMLLWLLWPAARALLRVSARARIGLLCAIGAGFALHLALDYLNSYGLHPFHPVDSRWLYGDLVFIVEPAFWVVFGVPMALMLRSRVIKIAVLALLAGAMLFFGAKGFLHWASLAGLAAVAVALGALQQRSNGRQALFAALLAGVGFVGVQALASSILKERVGAALTVVDPASRVVDIAASAFPSNPGCWNFVSVERNANAGSYRLRRGVASLAGNLDACPAALTGPVPQASGQALAFTWQDETSLARLRSLKAGNCHFDAWLRFARAPVLGATQAIDARFGVEPGSNLATIGYAAFDGQPCPQGVPGWGYPRADLLAAP